MELFNDKVDIFYNNFCFNGIISFISGGRDERYQNSMPQYFTRVRNYHDN